MKSKRMKWAGHVSPTGERGGVYRKPEGKRPLGRVSYRWEENNIVHLQEVGCGMYGLDR